MRRYPTGLTFIWLLVALHSALWLVLSHTVPDFGSDAVFNGVRVILILCAGWLVISKHIGGLWGSALSGGMALFIDHVVVTGGFFLLTGEREAFVGVLFSYLIFVCIAMFIGWLGGLVAKQFARNPA